MWFPLTGPVQTLSELSQQKQSKAHQLWCGQRLRKQALGCHGQHGRGGHLRRGGWGGWLFGGWLL